MRTFLSKQDTWLMLVIYGSEVLCGGAAIYTLYTQFNITNMIVAVFLVLVGVVFPHWLVASTKYVVSDTDLRISSGPFKWHVVLADIRAVTATKDPTSSPALSLDRLLITHAKGAVMVSPKDKKGFLAAIDQSI